MNRPFTESVHKEHSKSLHSLILKFPLRSLPPSIIIPYHVTGSCKGLVIAQKVHDLLDKTTSITKEFVMTAPYDPFC